MSAEIDGPEAARQRARELDDPAVTVHARDRFGLRAKAHPDDVYHAWDQGVPVHYPDTHHDYDVVRYNERDDLLLIADSRGGGRISTCIRLASRPIDQQEYIKNQVSDQ